MVARLPVGVSITSNMELTWQMKDREYKSGKKTPRA